MSICNNIKIYKMRFLLEEARFHNAFKYKAATWPIAKKNTSTYTPTTNSYDFARRFAP
jgi:hypothetical protein